MLILAIVVNLCMCLSKQKAFISISIAKNINQIFKD